MVNPKRKGGAFERDICGRLSMWITEGKSKDALWRSATSGGRSTMAVNKGEDAKEYQSSDISPVSKEAYLLLDVFSIECKHYKSLKFDQLLFSGTSEIGKFWMQAKRDSKRANKEPMLIMKQNYYPTIIGVHVEVYNLFRSLHLRERNNFPSALISTRLNIALMDFAQFLKVVRPCSLLEIRK